jgi:glycine cleavage system H protein
MVVLLFIATVATCILVDYALRGRRVLSSADQQELAPASVPLQPHGVANLRAPESTFFHPGHTWLAAEGDGYVRVGMDDFAQRLAGGIDELDPPEVGRSVRQGSPIWTVVRNGRRVSMISPVDGVVDEVNPAIVRDPSVIHSDPYNSGWIARIRVAELKRNMRNLLHGDVVQRWLDDAVLDIQTRLNANLGTVMADGGMLADDFGAALSDAEWVSVCREQFMSDPIE